MPIKLKGKEHYKIGVISDTHGKLLSSVFKAFDKVDLIVHAGDIGSKEVAERLRSIAPLVAVRGNMDFESWAEPLKEAETIEVGEVLLYVCHILDNAEAIPASADIQAVIYGHTHQSSSKRQNNILFLNPGSAGQKRYSNPLSVALLHIQGKDLQAEIIEL